MLVPLATVPITFDSRRRSASSTVRAALTGLRKKGHDITRGSREGMTCYLIEVA